jgi:hypothetical protein
MKDRLSFRTGEVSPFSQILLESVEDYSSTTRYAIDHLSRAAHPVLMIVHKSGVTLFDPVNAVCQLSYGPEEIQEATPQVQWPFRLKFHSARAVRALPAQDPFQTEDHFTQTVSPSRQNAEALLDTIGAGMDREENPVRRKAQTISPLLQTDTSNPSTRTTEPMPSEGSPAAQRHSLNKNMLDTFGAGLDREPPTEQQITEARERIAARIAADDPQMPQETNPPASPKIHLE